MPIRVSISELLGCLAIAAGCCLGDATPALAGPDGGDTGPNPYRGLRCGCRAPGPGDADPRQEIDRGIREGLSAPVPGLPPPRHYTPVTLPCNVIGSIV